jgi:hypothetical protein
MTSGSDNESLEHDHRFDFDSRLMDETMEYPLIAEARAASKLQIIIWYLYLPFPNKIDQHQIDIERLIMTKFKSIRLTEEERDLYATLARL